MFSDHLIHNAKLQSEWSRTKCYFLRPAGSHSPDLNNNNDDIAMVYSAVSCRDDDYFLASVL